MKTNMKSSKMRRNVIIGAACILAPLAIIGTARAVYGIVGWPFKAEESVLSRPSPIRISLREGRKIDGRMLRIENIKEDAALHLTVAVASLKDHRGRLTVDIPAGGSVDLGRLEFNWSFEGRQRGWISIDGHPYDVVFDIKDGQIDKETRIEKENI